MNRETKFRAWDGERMHFNSERDEYDYYRTMDLDGTFYPHDRPVDSYWDDSSSRLNKMNWTLMQYIGTKDKNGVEIYEGDVLEHPDGERFIVKWESISCKFSAVYSEHLSLAIFLQINDKGLAVVVGNVYENPELLEGE